MIVPGPRLPVFGLLASLMLAGLSAPALAQVTYPAKPEKYDIHMRYRIRTDRDDRIRQFRSMQSHLKELGFVQTPREDADLDMFDPTAEMLQGTIPSENARRTLVLPQVMTAIVIPNGIALGADGKKVLAVRINIATGFGAKAQHEFHSQTVRHLGFLGFREGVSYDHVGYTVIRGELPAESVMKLLKDLRTQPSGWFAPAIPMDQLPEPFRNTLPVRFVEVLPDTVEPLPAPTAAELAVNKLTSDVRTLLSDPAQAQKPGKFDVVLDDRPGLEWIELRSRIRTGVAGLTVEGLTGMVVTVHVPKAAEIVQLLELPEVTAIRLPRIGSETGQVKASTTGTTVAQALQGSNVAMLHAAGFRGDGVRMAIIGTDFSGPLPANARLIDLTAELSPTLTPAPAGSESSVGAAVARLASECAPRAMMTLIRIDLNSFHQLLTIARATSGDDVYSEAMQTRSIELSRQGDTLTIRRNAATEEYRKAFLDLTDTERATARRTKARKDIEQLIADETVFKGAVDRFTALKKSLDQLRGTLVVINTVVWETGCAQDGMTELSRYIDTKFVTKPVTSSIQANKQPIAPIWVQPASTAVGRVWAGPFQDEDGNNILDFASPETPLPKGGWTRELNFLQFTSAKGEQSTQLPAGAKLRVTIQWREPQDPDGYVPREPVFPMTLRLLRQLDSTGKSQATDEMAEVGHSFGKPVKLLRTVASGAFEQTLEVTIPVDGVYALRVEGQSAFEYQIPALRQKVEVQPRIVLETMDPATVAKGAITFQSFNTPAAGVAIPADSYAAVTVGVKTAPNAPAQNLTGAGPGLTLMPKPDLVAPSDIVVGNTTLSGTAASAAFVGGSTASLVSSGARINQLLKNLGLNPGDPFMLPAPWLSTLSRSKSER